MQSLDVILCLSFSGHLKKLSWDVFLEHHKLLEPLGKREALSEEGVQMAEAFICRIFKVPYNYCDRGRVHLFYNANHQRHCPLQVMQFNLIFKEQIIRHSFGNKLMCLFLQCHRLPHLVGRTVTESSSLFSPLFHLFQRHAGK